MSLSDKLARRGMVKKAISVAAPAAALKSFFGRVFLGGAGGGIRNFGENLIPFPGRGATLTPGKAARPLQPGVRKAISDFGIGLQSKGTEMGKDWADWAARRANAEAASYFQRTGKQLTPEAIAATAKFYEKLPVRAFWATQAPLMAVGVGAHRLIPFTPEWFQEMEIPQWAIPGMYTPAGLGIKMSDLLLQKGLPAIGEKLAPLHPRNVAAATTEQIFDEVEKKMRSYHIPDFIIREAKKSYFQQAAQRFKEWDASGKLAPPGYKGGGSGIPFYQRMGADGIPISDAQAAEYKQTSSSMEDAVKNLDSSTRRYFKSTLAPQQTSATAAPSLDDSTTGYFSRIIKE